MPPSAARCSPPARSLPSADQETRRPGSLASRDCGARGGAAISLAPKNQAFAGSNRRALIGPWTQSPSRTGELQLGHPTHDSGLVSMMQPSRRRDAARDAPAMHQRRTSNAVPAVAGATNGSPRLWGVAECTPADMDSMSSMYVRMRLPNPAPAAAYSSARHGRTAAAWPPPDTETPAKVRLSRQLRPMNSATQAPKVYNV